MKFKASVRNCRQLSIVCNTIKQFLRCAVIKLHPERMRFIATAGPAGGRSHVDGAQVWCALNTAAFFSDLRLESRSNGGAIYLDVPDIGPLAFALKACEKASGPVIMKLAQHGDRQLLTLSMNHAQTGHDALHEVPIRVMTESEVAAIAMPPMESDAIAVAMPPLNEVASVAERMRTAGATNVELSLMYCPSNDRIEAQRQQQLYQQSIAVPNNNTNASGGSNESVTRLGMTLTAEAHAIVIAVRWMELPHRPQGGGGGSNDNGGTGHTNTSSSSSSHGTLAPSSVPVKVSIDIKRFCRFFSVRDIIPIEITAHVVDQRALVLSVFADGDTTFIFYLPALLTH